MNDKLLVSANKIRSKVFLGGTISSFESDGRNQFSLLIRHGLNPDSDFLDIGCGCLRGGYWTMRFLDRCKYFGIEPNREMLKAGIDEIIGSELISDKKPSFNNNEAYDFSVFGRKQRFDYVMAGSIWTHAPKNDISIMMRQFKSHSKPTSIMFASFVRAQSTQQDYKGMEWVGKSHKSDKAGLVQHFLPFLEKMATENGVFLEHLNPNRFGSISWLKVTPSQS